MSTPVTQTLILVTSVLASLAAEEACRPGTWRCRDNTCIPQDKVCDWKPDCPDKSDEEKDGVCQMDSEDKCPDFMFKCGPVSGACISKKLIDNKVYDCIERTDENLSGGYTPPKRLRKENQEKEKEGDEEGTWWSSWWSTAIVIFIAQHFIKSMFVYLYRDDD